MTQQGSQAPVPRAGTIKAAIAQVMREAGEPLTAAEVYKLIVKRGYYKFKATDPLHVVRRQLRKSCEGLDFPSAVQTKYFVLHDDGRYFLVGKNLRSDRKPVLMQETGLSGLQTAHERYLDDFKKAVLRRLKKLSPNEFEHFCARFLSEYGFEEMAVTQRSADGGIDANGILQIGISKFRVAAQCKRWKSKKVGRPEVNQFRGDIQGRFEQGVFLTTGDFTKDALQVQLQPGAVPLVLINGSELVRQMIQLEFGIEKTELPTYSIVLDEVFERDQ